MYILDFSIHTHTNYLLITPEVENQERLPFIKGSVRVDKASLTQYVNHRISEVNHEATQMATLDWTHEDFSLRSQSLHLYSSMNPRPSAMRNEEMTGPVCRVGWSVSLDTKSEATAKLHTACATVRNRKKRTIIIKYHHFVTFKGIWNYFPPILLLVVVCQCLLSLFSIQ